MIVLSIEVGSALTPGCHSLGYPARQRRRSSLMASWRVAARVVHDLAMSKPLDVECPRCGAARGKSCRTGDRVKRDPHGRRVKAAANKG